MEKLLCLSFLIGKAFQFLLLQTKSSKFSLSQENVGLVIPWMVGILTFMSLEAVSTVYLNILRDHINGVSSDTPNLQVKLSALLNGFLPSSSPHSAALSISMDSARQKL
jgi:hypothetical protein